MGAKGITLHLSGLSVIVRLSKALLHAGGGGGREKIHPVRQNFKLVGGGRVSRLKKKAPKVEKVPGWVGCLLGTAVGVENLHDSGTS